MPEFGAVAAATCCQLEMNVSCYRIAEFLLFKEKTKIENTAFHVDPATFLNLPHFGDKKIVAVRRFPVSVL